MENETLEKTNLGLNFGSVTYYVILGKSLSYFELIFSSIKWIYLSCIVM